MSGNYRIFFTSLVLFSKNFPAMIVDLLKLPMCLWFNIVVSLIDIVIASPLCTIPPERLFTIDTPQELSTGFHCIKEVKEYSLLFKSPMHGMIYDPFRHNQ